MSESTKILHKQLAQSLRDHHRKNTFADHETVFSYAADTIEALQAENKALREALSTLDQFASAGADYLGSRLQVIVRAALTKTEGGER